MDALVSAGEFVSRGTKLSSLAFLSGFWNLTTSLVGTRTRLRPWRAAVSASSGIDLNSERFEQKTFDFLPDPRDRAAVVAAAMWLLEEPERLRETMRKTRRRASDITLGGKIEPWLRELLEEPPRPRRAPSPGEKRKADMLDFVAGPNRRYWYRIPQVAKLLKARGFYQCHFSQIVPTAEKLVATVRARNKGSRQRAAQCVDRASEEWTRLRALSTNYRKQRCRDPKRLREGILLLCSGRFLSSRDIADLLGRSLMVIKSRWITPLLRAGEIEPRFRANSDGIKNHPFQAYRTVGPRRPTM